MATKGNEVEFLRLAIEEAKKSVFEGEQVHPYVGAVVVSAGKVLASACRGEIKPGDHAEYTILEKKLGKQTLAGCTVYTTLEPCTTRNHPKVPCAARLIERRVARVVIGMLDPNQLITGKGVLQLRRAGIAVGLFPPDLMAELEELNRDFIREHQTKQLNGLSIGVIEAGLTAFYPSRNYYGRLRSDASTIDRYVATAQHTAVLVSTNLMTAIPFHDLCSCLEQKLTNPPREFRATISLLDPRCPELMMVMAPILGTDADDLSQSIRRSLKELLRLKRRLPDSIRKHCGIRVHTTIPFGSAIMLDHHEANGRIQVETKPYKAGLQNSFAFEIARTGESHLYDVLATAFDALLKDGEVYTGHT
jgi:pyrimidine deaminase RibD-like protein